MNHCREGINERKYVPLESYKRITDRYFHETHFTPEIIYCTKGSKANKEFSAFRCIPVRTTKICIASWGY